jgi:hypothetical protein
MIALEELTAMSEQERWIARFTQRVLWGRFLHQAANWLAVFLFVFGTLVLLVKLSLPALWPQVLWLGLLSVPSALAAWLAARRTLFTRTESIAMLDRQLDAGGLLMTLSESPATAWQPQLPQQQHIWQQSLPKIRPIRFTKHLSLPLAFAIGACLVPLRAASLEPVLRNTVGRQATEQLEEMLTQLDQASVLAEEEKEKLREEIEKLADETKQTPLTHEKWETVDALREQMRTRLESSSLTFSKALDAVSALAKCGSGDASELSIKRVEQLEKDLLDAMKKLAANGAFSNASPELRQRMERMISSGQFRLPANEAERNQLLGELDQFLEQESRQLGELRKGCEHCQQGALCDCQQPGGT